MQEIKYEYVLTLAKLLLKGAKDNFVKFTSTDIGIEINKSQQAASKIILELQELKYVERVKKGHSYLIRVTEEGLESVKKMSDFFNMALYSLPENIHFNGVLVSGMGEGKYYMMRSVSVGVDRRRGASNAAGGGVRERIGWACPF